MDIALPSCISPPGMAFEVNQCKQGVLFHATRGPHSDRNDETYVRPVLQSVSKIEKKLPLGLLTCTVVCTSLWAGGGFEPLRARLQSSGGPKIKTQCPRLELGIDLWGPVLFHLSITLSQLHGQ